MILSYSFSVNFRILTFKMGIVFHSVVRLEQTICKGLGREFSNSPSFLIIIPTNRRNIT